MKTIDVADANTTLGDYARKGLREPLVVTRRGKPVLALTPLKDDSEGTAIANNPKFRAIIRRSRASLAAGKGVSLDEVRRHLGLEKRKKK